MNTFMIIGIICTWIIVGLISYFPFRYLMEKAEDEELMDLDKIMATTASLILGPILPMLILLYFVVVLPLAMLLDAIYQYFFYTE